MSDSARTLFQFDSETPSTTRPFKIAFTQRIVRFAIPP